MRIKLVLTTLLAFLLYLALPSCDKKKPPLYPKNETGTVIDIDGNTYQTLKIGDQWWMAKNLMVTRYRNGDAIPNVTDDSTWAGLTTGAHCSYNNDINNVETYGHLYNEYAVNDSRGLAPYGWHVPGDEEWKELEVYLGMSQSEINIIGQRGTDEGGKLKEAGTLHWDIPNTGANNESGFSALPGGACTYAGGSVEMGRIAYFWSSTEYDFDHTWYRYLHYNSAFIYRYAGNKRLGHSVRCIKDK